MIKKAVNKSEILFILDNLRNEDKQELFISSGENWKEKTLFNLENKDFLILYGNDNTGRQAPIAMGGFCETDKNESIACVWLLSTFFVYKNRMLLAKELKTQIAFAEQKYKIMYNYIYKSNFDSKNWLKKLGFKFDNPKPPGLDIKEDFEFFYKVSERI